MKAIVTHSFSFPLKRERETAMSTPCAAVARQDAKDESSSQREAADEPRTRLLSESSSSLSSLPSLNFDHRQPPSIITHQLVSTLRGHSSIVSALAVRGDLLYSGSSDNEIRVWSSNPSEDGHASRVVAVCPSAIKFLAVAGDKLLAAHQDNKIRVWDIDGAHKRGHRLNAVLPTCRDRLRSLLRAENYVEVRRHKRRTWVHHVDAVSALALSHDRSLLYSASWDRTLKVWRTSDYRCAESVAAAHHDAINAVAVSRCGVVYTGSADTTVRVWRRRAGEPKHALVATLEKHRAAVNALALSADGRVLYSGACDRSVVVWEGGGDACLSAAGALRGHAKAVLCLATVADIVCSGSADRTVRVWRRGEERGYVCVAVLEGHGGPIKSLAVAESGNSTNISSSESSYHVYSGSMDCDVMVWRVSTPCFRGNEN